ncbi:MAG: orotidine-5'-phosphate decarboxylase [Trueperaceae bacterium]|jgi:orotidine-5'-phosphate decarboxylase|nr:orotidine-5'-phosphate decarboxylase [Trueperaceae bacterium]MCH2667684.1 orotidine-5'-phosphate decarboxylase [Deinococcales bacterium]|tara:strand:- start:27359 stop:28246 length:888 start_codon:yes stop_codon:yes gene_type:complete
MKPFLDQLQKRIDHHDTRVCLGIDPRPTQHPSTNPANHDGDPAQVARAVVNYFRAILEETEDLIACVKLQIAFFEGMGVSGHIALAQLLADCRSLGIPTILDAKRGDIGSTAEAYAGAYLADGVFSSDALTVNPYLGFDSLDPFVSSAVSNGRGLFVLVKTSNPGSRDLQDLVLASGKLVYRQLAEELHKLAAKYGTDHTFSPIGAVVAGTFPEILAEIRAILPKSLLLVPGFGAQGAGPKAVSAAFMPGGQGAIINASRSLTYLGEHTDFWVQSRQATLDMRDALNRQITTASS